MRDKIRLPFRHIRLQGLEGLCQKGMEVWAFAQKFWTGVERLGCHGGDVKDIFNSGLDESLPHWEMELVRSLDFWNFSRYLQLRKEGKIIHHRQSPPAGAVSSPPPSSSQAQDPSLIPTLKQRSRRRRGARTPVVPSPVVLEGPNLVVLEDLTLVVPNPMVLEDLTLVVPEVTEQPALFLSPMILALPVPPIILAMLTPPRLLALLAPTKLLALASPPQASSYNGPGACPRGRFSPGAPRVHFRACSSLGALRVHSRACSSL